MRSDRPIPGNPWPHDMVITVDAPNNIIEFLFIHSAWRIASEQPLPVLVPEPHHGTSSPPPDVDVQEWSRRWQHTWERAWQWYSRWDKAQLRAEWLRLSQTHPRLDPAFQPPFWGMEHGRDGIDGEALAAWEEQLRRKDDRTGSKEPEVVCLPAVIAAWRTGLTTVLTLPYEGYFAERVLATHLVVSNQTRTDPQLYARALTTPLSRQE
ncbi:hypothetical protein IV498_16470 [Paenarthrobacter sp. Z7-10]|uniref:hypothetical protein n=1 Tax=Paenarthrobacter sp. Z7-10 TaxID=2787635 RepID=UPI0022A94F15|nr:hypothetical protein [Paenarthrobacter sp. Z7-10]MCZ2404726.1 hypothetical protein [Paenarthrobacter sp. Z7-10]